MELVVVFDGTLFQAQMVKNLLENEGIEAYLKDELIGSKSFGWNPTGGVKVVVADLNYSKARTIVEEYEKSSEDD
ncbi:MAG: DUF2007 domain-containing protein [Bacteroidales bacterium]|nr:DUF2007 domain-containing protein [Bacteroidales bacterium]HPD95768.1 DUF2007 domain-containing protein [Tenuifilaceae bacterium]HRX31098.1 DUF2007 domain-containing protein [Tenuifilaceae bacterium]